MYRDDAVRLQHMLDAAKEIRGLTAGRSRIEMEKDRVLGLAVMRLIEVMGEAAAQVTKEYQDQHPDIPWPQIVGMRNRLIHAYFDVDMERLWDTVQRDIPSLTTALERLVPPQSSA